MKYSRSVIPASKVSSLVWQGDALVDWVSGGRTFHLDGTCRDPRINGAFPFDAACSTPDGQFAVIYQRCGTKALLLSGTKCLRELNRSFYQAHVYEYPICIWQAPDDRVLIAHCPEHYNQIEIEDAQTGVVCFFKHPRIISLASGKTIVQYEDLDTGTQSSSIIWNAILPAMAIDSENHRFAVASANEITVIQVEL